MICEYPDTIYTDVLALAITMIRSAQEHGVMNVPYLKGQIHGLDAVAMMYGRSCLLDDLAYLLPDLEDIPAKKLDK